MKPIIKYRGGKSQELKNFIHHISNESFDTYFEPFFGGGAMYFALEPEKAVINDTNLKLMSLYQDVRDHYEKFHEQLHALGELYLYNQQKYSQLKASSNQNERVLNKNESLYYYMRREFNDPSGAYLDGVVYYFINKTAYSGMIRYNKKGEYNVPFGRYKNFNSELVEESHSKLLQTAELYHTDYSEIFHLAKPEDIMFLDPPYDCVFNDYGNLEKEDGFNEEEQRRLAQDFRNLNTRALMIINKTPLTEELYRNYKIGEYEKRYSVNIKNRFKNTATHMIVKNY